jgi:predicted cupin superfamily sugar epimerase
MLWEAALPGHREGGFFLCASVRRDRHKGTEIQGRNGIYYLICTICYFGGWRIRDMRRAF